MAGARLGGAALVLAVPVAVLVSIRGRGVLPMSGQARGVVVYGVVALAGAQLCYFSAVRTLSVGVALLVEYMAPVLLLAWSSLRAGAAPRPATLLGAVTAVAGLVLVLDLTGEVRVDVAGVVWALGAAICMAGYYALSAADDAPHPVVLTAFGALVGAVLVGAVGLVGLLPWTVATASADLGGRPTPWWVVVLLIGALSTAAAYVSGILAIGRLGPRVASFVGLTEVLVAVLLAWWLLSERLSAVQVLGGVVVVVGIGVVRAAEREREPVASRVGSGPGGT